jgi:amino acid transporter
MSQISAAPTDSGSRSTSLLRSSINFLHIVLMVTAAAAPLVVASTYIPISMGYGSGMATPITYAATTVILLIFSVGFAQMAKRMTSAGAFYTFSAQGLGRPLGLSVGFTVLAAYSMISAAIVGGFGYYGSALLDQHFGVSVPWYVVCVVGLLTMFAISYFRVTFTARILAVLLALEVLIVLVVALATVFAGGTEGQQLGSLSPTEWGAAPAIGIGFFLAFWSWIGFETTAIYGEETRDPKESVPRATYIAVTTLGVFYTFVAYAGIVGFGSDSPGQAATLIDQYFFVLADEHTFGAVRTLMDFLVVSGFFACSFAFHNNASRYFYSLGRDGILPRALGRTHRDHKSPHIAAGVQVAIAIGTVVIFAVGGADPLLHLATWLPIFCTLAVLLVQFLVCLAVIGYFNRVGRSDSADWLKTLIAPAVGAVAQAAVMYLLVDNIGFLAGDDVLIVKLIPVYVGAIAAFGFAYAMYLRSASPDRYAAIGELHDDEMEELFVDEIYADPDRDEHHRVD